MTCNIRSLNKNFDELETITKEYKPLIICLCEVFRPYEPLVDLKGHHPILTKLRPANLKGGGAALYVSRLVKYERLEVFDHLKLDCIEVVAAIVSLNNQEAVTILSVYRPPGSNQNDTIKDLELILRELGN